MAAMRDQRGITLIEIAIVPVIIDSLLGGTQWTSVDRKRARSQG